MGLVAASGCNTFTSQGRNSQGVALFDRGQYQEALREFQEASYADPNNPDAYYNLGATHHQLGKLRNQPEDLAQAETCYRQCLDRNPNHRDCHRGLAVLLAEQGRTEEAFRSVQSWVDQQPTSAEPKIELARLHEEFGNRAAAKERLIEALTADPQNAREWTALGRIREQSGEYAQALANYQRSLEINSSQPEVAARVLALQSTLARQVPTPVPTAVPGGPTPTLASPPTSLR
jgi:tetratricopeptide (TPR) repeat protein